MLPLLVILPLTTAAQQDADIDSYSNEELLGKYRLYTRFRNIGLSVLGGSVLLLGTGIVLLSNAKPLPSGGTRDLPDSAYTDADFRQRNAGNVLIILGAAFPAIGTTFTILGARKRREYRERMYLQGVEVSIGFSMTSVKMLIDI